LFPPYNWPFETHITINLSTVTDQKTILVVDDEQDLLDLVEYNRKKKASMF